MLCLRQVSATIPATVLHRDTAPLSPSLLHATETITPDRPQGQQSCQAPLQHWSNFSHVLDRETGRGVNRGFLLLWSLQLLGMMDITHISFSLQSVMLGVVCNFIEICNSLRLEMHIQRMQYSENESKDVWTVLPFHYKLYTYIYL